MTEPFRVAILGNQGGGGPDFAAYLAREFAGELKQQLANWSDYILWARFDDPELGFVEVSSSVPPSLDPYGLACAALASADVALWMHTLNFPPSPDDRYLEAMLRAHESIGRSCPVLVGFNDYHLGQSAQHVYRPSDFVDCIPQEWPYFETELDQRYPASSEKADALWSAVRSASRATGV